MSSLFERRGRVFGLGLAVVVFLTPLAFGGVHGWASALVESAVWVLSFGWFTVRRLTPAAARAPAIDRPFLLAALVLAGYLACPLVPLPRAWLAALSPATAEFYRHTVDAIAPIPLPDQPIESVGEIEDRRAPVDARTRIAALAAEHPGIRADGRRPLALYPFAAQADLLRYLAYGFALWLAATLPRPASLLRAIVLTGTVVAALGIAENVTSNGYVLWFFSPYELPANGTARLRMSGPFVNPDHFAAFLAMVLPCGAALIGLRLRRGEVGAQARAFAAGRLAFGLALIIAALIGSASRGGLTGAGFGLLVFWLGIREQRANDEKESGGRAGAWPAAARRFAPPIIAGTILLAGFVYAGPHARQTLADRVEETLIAPDLDSRVRLWRQSLPILADFPVFGVGAGGWRDIMPRYQHYPIVNVLHTHAHNDYLEWAIEVGGAGVLLTAVLVCAYVRWARRNHAIPPTAHWGILAAVTAIGLHELFDFGLRMPANALLLSVLLGLRCNRGWSDGGASAPETAATPGGATAARIPARTAAVAAAALAALVLGLGSRAQFREFMQWQSVRDGRLVLDFAPADARTWGALGAGLFDAGFRYYPPTGAVYRSAARLRPANGDAYWHLSLVAPRYEDKVLALEAALYVEPGRTPWRLVYAADLDVLGRSGDALAQVEEAVYRDPRLRSHPYAGNRPPPSGEVLAAVERGLQRALAARPDDPDLLAEQAAYDDLRGRWSEAAARWMRAAELGGFDRFGLRAAESYARAGDFPRAEHAARRAIDAAPEQPAGYRVLAMSVFHAQQRDDDAAHTLQLGLRRSRDAPALYLALSDLQRARGDIPGALAALAEAADRHPRNAGLQLQLGAAYLDAGNALRAKLAFERAIRLDERQAQPHYRAGIACERLYDLAGARDAYRKAAQLDPSNERYSQALAKIEGLIAEASGGP